LQIITDTLYLINIKYGDKYHIFVDDYIKNTLGSEKLTAEQNMKRTLAVIISIIVATAPGCTKKPEITPPIKIAISTWPGYAHAFIARDKGFFKKNGVPVELLFTKEITDAMKLYETGKADGIFTVLPDVLMLNSEGLATAVVCLTDYSQTGDVIIAKPGITSLAGLKDRTISFEGINSFSHIFVLRALKNAGLDETDVKLVNIPAQQVLASLEQGKIDAGHTWPPAKNAALEKGYKVLVYAKDTPGTIIDVLAFNKDIIRKRPKDIQAILKSLFEALDFIRSNKEEALTIMAKSEGMTKDEMQDGLDSVFQPGLKDNARLMKASNDPMSVYRSWQNIHEFYLKRGQLSRMFQSRTIIDSQFIDVLLYNRTNAEKK